MKKQNKMYANQIQIWESVTCAQSVNTPTMSV